MADGECLDTSLVRLEDDGSLTTIEGWAGVYDGHAYPAPLVVSPEGDVWLIGDTTTGDWRADVLLRFDGTDWEVFPLPEGFESHPMDTALGFDPDGTLWVHAGGFVRHDAPDLVRFDDPRWSPFTVPGGTRSHVSGRDTLTIAPDGSFWLPGKSFDSGSPGVAHYDGTTATPYLVGSAPSDLAIAPDGSVWLYSEAGSQGHIYVITPGAVATREAEAIEPPPVEEASDTEEATTTISDLLSGMVTEEVEPGVYRVDNDGVRNLASVNDTDIVAGEDGGIYLLRPQRFVRLGSDEWQAWDTEDFHSGDFEVAKEGGAWTSAIESVAGEEWTPLEGSIVTAVDMAPDGTVWAFWEDRWQDPAVQRRAVFAYLDEDGWQTLGHLDRVNDLLVAGPDDIWATAGLWPRNYLHRFVDGAWQRLVGFEGTEPTWQPAEEPVADDTGQFDHGPDGGVGLGPDGTLWGVRLGDDFDLLDLVRFDGSGWSRWSLDDSLLDAGFIPAVASPLRVASDGSIWFAAMEPPDDYGSLWFAVGEPWDDFCEGVGHFDGVTPGRFLSDLCIKTIDITADGAVWLLANEPDVDLRHVYVITPEAVADKEAEIIEPPVSEEPTDAEEMLTATENLMPGMVTEEVEPGVLRVINDGVRDLGSVEAMDIVAGYDDGIWLLWQDHFFRLRSDGVHEWPSGLGDLPWDDFEVTPPWHDFEVTADGMVWAAMETDADLESEPQDSGVNLWSYDGSEWEPQKPTYLLDGPIEDHLGRHLVGRMAHRPGALQRRGLRLPRGGWLDGGGRVALPRQQPVRVRRG